MKQVIFKKQPLKFLQKLDVKTKQRIINAIYSLPDGDVKPLRGYHPYKRLRIGPYRVIFDESGCIYTITKIGNRGDVYK
ncbi:MULTISPECIES: type II toxin-antitoxin system RelE family toxin [Enterococcus]|uniref:type II toxin-antitoxin system RelE family toxin n=1 Tax=Enterococcus TaxID=1350 RepID=UPI001163BFF7|nr:type II toxin-antitoxin system RelE/ParE family toxin [Enterococcus avium]HAP3021227.1 type II toxin-antitoxin system RelE/ParE family toxin [Enterococcus faecalis]AYQ24197.1 plasmid stabilization protein [Enterococcus avium]HBI1562057.1 type II toxin-antitoxin system RelE/ParE family toxin [Enterococcus faecalis]HBI1565116.1 type II toxin-antitoxin system RelE/ParE family toxin [Enterococcus faecalis]HBI1717428.1 type II toxin-antitoxin system RelE/ParE family toxin [Enterococcus faecalis]